FLLIFSGCLGFGEDDIPEQEEKDTVEPVGENDLEGLENDVNLLTSRLDAEEAKLALLETRINGITDSPDALDALGCKDGEIARYDGNEWVCSEDTDTTLNNDEVWNIVSGDFDDVRNDIDNVWADIDYIEVMMDDRTEEFYEDMDNMSYTIYDHTDKLENMIYSLNDNITDMSYKISDLFTDVDNLWSAIYEIHREMDNMTEEMDNMSYEMEEMQERIDELENMTSCQLVPYSNCAGADLSNQNLSGMDLTGINFRNANLNQADLTD
ncbi:uncharacterized protein METZ01_LOCUS428774, partial [marine metagenome]